MLRYRVVRLAMAAAVLCPGAARAGEIVLDYKTTVRLASERAPAVIAARGGVGEARGRRAGAAVVSSNPEVAVSAGPRRRGDASSTDVEVGVAQSIELGRRRGARIGMAEAAVDGAEAEAAEALRAARRDALMAYYHALAAEQRLRVARDAEAVASDIAAATERRLARGDALELDVSLARAALGRARVAVRAAEGDREVELGRLRTILAVDPGDSVAVKGDLSARRTYDLATILAGAGRRPDVLAFAAEEEAGAAQVRLGDGRAWPDVRLGVSYAREEEADIVLGGLTFTLPIFERGQEERQVGRARRVRAATARAALLRAAGAEIAAAFAAHARRVLAVDEFEKQVIPTLDQSDRLLARSYQAGQITLADYLAARRELLDARTEYLQRLVEMAEASVELELAAGVIP